MERRIQNHDADRELPSFPEKFQGSDLKDKVKKSWEKISRLSAADTPHHSLFETFALHLDDLPTSVWEAPRNTGEITTFYSSASSAFQYAHLKTDRELVPPSELTTIEDCWSMFEKATRDPEKSSLFYENLWRPPTTFHPERGIVLQYILRHHFSDAAITGVDIGAGPGVILPLLNSQRFLDVDFTGKEALMDLFGNNVEISLDLGLGIDKHEQEINREWAYANASSWSYKPGEFEKVIEEIEPKKGKFPYITTDMTDRHVVGNIQKALSENGRDSTVAFILSSYVRYQLSHDRDTQQTFINSVTSLLKEGGIWIDIGEEFMDPDHNLGEYKVKVYKKTNNALAVPSVPFVVNERGDIKQTNLDYFLAA